MTRKVRQGPMCVGLMSMIGVLWLIVANSAAGQTAEAFYASGAQGYRYLPWRAHLSIAVAARVYRQIGVQLRAADCAWHDGRQVTGKVTKLRCSVVALASLPTRLGAAVGRHDQRLHLALRGLPYVV